LVDLQSKARHHAISSMLKKPFEFKDKPFVVQWVYCYFFLFYPLINLICHPHFYIGSYKIVHFMWSSGWGYGTSEKNCWWLSQSPTTVLFRTTLTWMITLYKLLILLGSNHLLCFYKMLNTVSIKKVKKKNTAYI